MYIKVLPIFKLKEKRTHKNIKEHNMPNYQTGKVYKICDVNENLVYIGSTTKTLSQRMSGHRSTYKRKEKTSNWSVFKIFDEYGVDNCKILLLELFPCNSRDELSAREGHFILNLICVNKNIAGRSYKESKQAYRDTHKEYIKQHNIDTTEQRKITAKKWRIANKEHIKEYKLKKKLEKQNQSLEIVDTPSTNIIIT